MQIEANSSKKTVGDPCAAYLSMLPVWKKIRAILGGETAVKDHDAVIDTINFSNILIPFSERMNQSQYNFFKAEAELPGLCAQYLKVLKGGLLRKESQLELADIIPEDATDWIKNSFTADNESIGNFLSTLLDEELATTSSWIAVDMPPEPVEGIDAWPYPIIHKAESVINWRYSFDIRSGDVRLTHLVTRYIVEVGEGLWTDSVEEVRHYYLDESGLLVVDVYHKNKGDNTRTFSQGQELIGSVASTHEDWMLVGTYYPEKNGSRLDIIPIFPVNGERIVNRPILLPIIERERHLYNKIARRNHLLYGASTYTPYVKGSGITEEAFSNIVSAGLGSWLFIPDTDAEIGVLETPTSALKDIEAAIQNTIEDLHRMGIRILAPETSESGIALEIRNASQTVQLGLLNTNISDTMKKVIRLMIEWKYNIEIEEEDVSFSLSTDFNPAPVGEAWLRLITEWYESRHISRETFVKILIQNDVLPGDHDDKVELEQIDKSPLNTNPAFQVNLEEEI